MPSGQHGAAADVPQDLHQRRPKCRCDAYKFPHRPGGGLCRYPDPPAVRWQDAQASEIAERVAKFRERWGEPSPEAMADLVALTTKPHRPYRKRYAGILRQIRRVTTVCIRSGTVPSSKRLCPPCWEGPSTSSGSTQVAVQVPQHGNHRQRQRQLHRERRVDHRRAGDVEAVLPAGSARGVGRVAGCNSFSLWQARVRYGVDPSTFYFGKPLMTAPEKAIQG